MTKKIKKKKCADTTALFHSAINYFNQGFLAKAKKDLFAIIKNDKKHSDAFNLLGIIRCREGQQKDAVHSFETAVKINPENEQYHNNLGIAVSDIGDHETAIRHYERSLSLNPSYTDARYNLGISYTQTGRFEDALSCYNTVIENNPGFVKAYNNAGSTLLKMGNAEEAVRYLTQAVTIHPGFPEALNNLGNAYHVLKKPDESIQCYKKAIELAPRISQTYLNLGEALADTGHKAEACICYQQGLSIDPDNKTFWQGLCDTLPLPDTLADQPRFEELLSRCLRQTGVNKQSLVKTAGGYLKKHPDILFLCELLKQTSFPPPLSKETYDKICHVISMPLLIQFLATIVNTDFDLEWLITRLRRIVTDLAAAENNCEPFTDFVSALAIQCFMNEYIFFETETEKKAIDSIQRTLPDNGIPHSSRTLFKLMLYAAYRPLHTICNNHQNFQGARLTPLMQAVIRQQVTEPMEEERLKAGFTPISAIEDKTSKAVRTQYEENPYPRWLDFPAIVSFDFNQRLQKITGRHPAESNAVPFDAEVLIAGCGTGRQALHTAAHMPKAKITAVDLSLSSLSYAKRKVLELKNTSISFYQADILELASLEKQFDIIECSGVLHHMENPVSGWEVLVSLLKKGGFMLTGLYSETARKSVVATREYIRQNGFKPVPEDIRTCRQKLFGQPDGTLLKSITGSREFYTMSTCRDLLFHVQEHRFSIPEISDILDKLGLEFIGFEFGRQSGIIPFHFKQRFPEKGSASRLSLWHIYEEENPHIFEAMYQFWAQKK